VVDLAKLFAAARVRPRLVRENEPEGDDMEPAKGTGLSGRVAAGVRAMRGAEWSSRVAACPREDHSHSGAVP